MGNIARSASATNITAAAGVTTAETNELLVGFVASGRNVTGTNFRATSPSTGSGATDTTTHPTDDAWIERADSGTATSPSRALQVFDTVKTAAGATGDPLATISAPNASVMALMAFKRQG